MCIAILQKTGATTLSNDVITNCYNNNSDGSGIAFVDENHKIQVRKYRELDSFVDQYQQLHRKYGNQTPFMIHSRIGTHGTSDGNTNVHPFWVNDQMVFCHNGIIRDVRDDKVMSDTQVFNQDYLKQLPNLWIQNPATIRLVSNFIGQSKLIFLSSDKSFKIINKELGHWDEKTWFSNSSYKRGVFDFGGSSTCSIPMGYSRTWPGQSKPIQRTIFEKSQSDTKPTIFDDSYHDVGYRERSQYRDAEPCYLCDETTVKQKTDDHVGGQWLCTPCYRSMQ